MFKEPKPLRLRETHIDLLNKVYVGEQCPLFLLGVKLVTQKKSISHAALRFTV